MRDSGDYNAFAARACFVDQAIEIELWNRGHRFWFGTLCLLLRVCFALGTSPFVLRILRHDDQSTKHEPQRIGAHFSCHKLLCDVKSPSRDPNVEGEMSEHELKPVGAKVQGFNFFAGVILPAISITLEATTHIAAMQFFDPLPTTWHLMLVVFVPLAQLHVWFTIRRGTTRHPFLAELVNAVVIGISLFYSIVYLPLMPFGAMLLIVGLGLLPLTPLLSLVAAIVMSVQLKRLIALTSPQRSFWTKVRALALGLDNYNSFDCRDGTSGVGNTIWPTDGSLTVCRDQNQRNSVPANLGKQGLLAARVL